MTENFEEKLNRLTELLEKQIEAFGNLNDSTEKTEQQQQKALEDAILQEKGYKKVKGNLISIEEERINAEERLTKELDDKFGKDTARNAKIEAEYNKQLKAITDIVNGANELTQAQNDNLTKQRESTEYIAAVQKTEYNKQLAALNEVIKGSIEITDAQKENLVKLKQSKEYIVAQQANDFKKQAEALGATVGSNGKLLDVNGKIIQNSAKLTGEQQKQLDQLKAGGAGKHFGQTAEKFKDINNITNLASDKLKDLAGNSALATSGLQLAGSVLEGTIKGLTVFTSSVYKGERGAAVTAKSLNELTKTVGDTMTGIGTAFAIFSFFMPGGIIVKGLKIVGGILGALGGQLVKGYGELQKLGAEQNDALFKAYNRLSASGLGAAKGLEGVIDTVHTLNMSVPEIEKFTELLTNNSKELKLLGATAGEGAQNFAKVAGELSKSKIGEQLERLGVTAEEQREHTLRYMVNQTRMGLAQGKTQQELIRGSQQYIEELDKVAMLTGASRKDQEEARAAVMAENELSAAIYEAKKNKDFELLEKLNQAAELAKNLKVMGDTRGMTGVSKYAAAGFNATDEVSGAAMQTFNEALTNISQGKGGSASDNLSTALKGLQTSMDNYAGVAKYGSDTKALQTVDMAKGRDMVGVKESFDEKRKQDPNKSANDILTEIQNERKTGDERLKATVEGNRMQQASAQIMDAAAFQYNDAAKIHAAASTKFKEAVDTFAKIAGARPVAGGTNVNGTPPSSTPTTPPKPVGNLGSGAASTPPGMTPGVSPLSGKPIDSPALSKPTPPVTGSVLPPNNTPFPDPLGDRSRREDKPTLATPPAPTKPTPPVTGSVLPPNNTLFPDPLGDRSRREDKPTLATPPNSGAAKMGELTNQRRSRLEGASQGIATSLPSNLTPKTSGVKSSTTVAPYNAERDSQSASMLPTPSPGVQVASNTPGLPKTSGSLFEGLFTFGSRSGSKSNFEQLTDSIKNRIINAATSFKSLTGGTININSAKRDPEDQKRLWDESVEAGRPGRTAKNMPIGKPGTSKHERGMAVDIQNYDDPKAVAAMNAQGLFQTVPKDPVHFEMAKFGGVFNGPESGYDVELHGREAIIPLPDPKSMISVTSENVKKDPLTTVMKPVDNIVKLPEPKSMVNINENIKKDPLINKPDESILKLPDNMAKLTDGMVKLSNSIGSIVKLPEPKSMVNVNENIKKDPLTNKPDESILKLPDNMMKLTDIIVKLSNSIVKLPESKSMVNINENVKKDPLTNRPADNIAKLPNPISIININENVKKDPLTNKPIDNIAKLPDPKSIINTNENVKKDSLTEVMNNTSNITLPGMDQLTNITEVMMQMMENKFDEMISKLSTGNDIQDKLLRNTMV